jgi:hypothetical protein
VIRPTRRRSSDRSHAYTNPYAGLALAERRPRLLPRRRIRTATEGPMKPDRIGQRRLDDSMDVEAILVTPVEASEHSPRPLGPVLAHREALW